MRTVASWPPAAHDTLAVAEAYTQVLGWPLIAGTTFVSPDRAAAELADPDTQTQLSTPCSAFDAVTVARAVGTGAMVLFERRGLGPVPCMIEGHDRVVLLVRAGTGRFLSGLEFVVGVEAGSGGRLVLPPSSGRWWDTPPWALTAEKPCRLPDGSALVPSFVDALRLRGNGPSSTWGGAPPSAGCPARPGSS
jgi:hypothetical protein